MIDIVIPTYNGSCRIHKLLSTIAQQSYQDYCCFLIDDHSTDDTVAVVQSRYPWVEIIRLDFNRGPAYARNVGVAAGHSPYIVFFDDDAYIADPHWLKYVAQRFEKNHQLGQIATMIVSAQNPEVLIDCGIFQAAYKFGGLFYQRRLDQLDELHKRRKIVLGACSAGTAIRRSALEKAGGFDSRYFYPVEDLDVSLRIHLIGFDVIYDPTLVVYHYVSQSMESCVPRKLYLSRRNCLLAIVDNYPVIQIITILSKMILKEIVLPLYWYCRYIVSGKSHHIELTKVRDYTRSILFLMTTSLATLRKRRAVNVYRRRSRRYLRNLNDQFLRGLGDAQIDDFPI